jgi:hypothetical protein
MRAPSDDLVARAVTAISPDAHRREECRRDIQQALHILKAIKPQLDVTTPGEMRQLLRDHVKLCTAFAKKVRTLPPPARSATFAAAIKQEIDRVQALAASLPVRHGARPRNLLMWATAAIARDLLRDHGKKATLTVGGPWFVLASTLFELLTGTAADLSGYCRRCDIPGYGTTNRGQNPIFRVYIKPSEHC